MPAAKRGDKPDAIAWLVKHHSELKDAQIAKLVGDEGDINKVRERTHWNIQNITARHPVLLGLCSQIDLDAVEKAGGTTGRSNPVIESMCGSPSTRDPHWALVHPDLTPGWVCMVD